MAFIRTKSVNGILYSYRVESYRQAGKVRQRVLGYLGRAAEKPAAPKKPKKVKRARVINKKIKKRK